MRHIRDPVSGQCVVCDKGKPPGSVSSHPATPAANPHPGHHPSWDNARRKIIYVNAFNPSSNRPPPNQGHEPPPHEYQPPHDDYRKERPPSYSREPKYSPDSGITDPQSRGSVASTSRVFVVPAGVHPQAQPPPVVHNYGYYKYNERPTGPPPPQHAPPQDRYYREPPQDERYRPRSNTPPDKRPPRTPSPQGGCCRGGHSQNSRGYGRGTDMHRQGYYDKYGRPYDGRADPRVGGKSYGNYGNTTPNWGRRRCCAILLGLLLLLLLAALAVGLYFGITEGKKASAANDPANNPDNQAAGGYYVNGQYVIPVSDSPREVFMIYGVDQPCNPYNNNTFGNETIINCQDKTTQIVPNPNYTLAPWVTTNNNAYASADYVTSCLLCILFSLTLSVLKKLSD